MQSALPFFGLGENEIREECLMLPQRQLVRTFRFSDDALVSKTPLRVRDNTRFLRSEPSMACSLGSRQYSS